MHVPLSVIAFVIHLKILLLQDLALTIAMDMASAFQMGPVNVKMGTLALTALLVLKLSFSKCYPISWLVIFQLWPHVSAYK